MKRKVLDEVKEWHRTLVRIVRLRNPMRLCIWMHFELRRKKTEKVA